MRCSTVVSLDDEVERAPFDCGQLALLSLGQLGAGPSLDQERYEVSNRALLKLLVRVANCQRNLVRAELRVLAG